MNPTPNTVEDIQEFTPTQPVEPPKQRFEPIQPGFKRYSFKEFMSKNFPLSTIPKRDPNAGKTANVFFVESLTPENVSVIFSILN